MTSRRKLVVGNWKMHGTVASAQELSAAVTKAVRSIGGVAGSAGADIALCPASAHLATVASVLESGPVRLGAQNAHMAESGAYTGEISMPMLIDIGCHYVILGHSERRTLFSETSEFVAQKVEAALHHQLIPILCVGETLEQREAGQLRDVIHAQLGEVLSRVGIDALTKVVVAYEPVWAIGTGKTASPAQAQDVHAMIRQRLAEHSESVSAQTQILYGGSVKSGNAADLFSQADIDGGLIGGAALDADSFLAICQAAAAA